MAAMPSPRPVSPRPSVVVPLTDTGAPQADPRAASASSRRGPILGRSPITCTATLPIRNPASPTRRAHSVSSRTPDAPDHSGRSVPKTVPRSPRPGRRQQGVAAGVGGDVAVGVPAETGRLVRPGETGQRHRTPRLERVDVDTDADAGRRH